MFARGCQRLSLLSQRPLQGCRYFSMELQADIPKTAPPVLGFNIVANRLANIVLNITEKKPSNILHVYPENHLLSYIGEVNYLAMAALCNSGASAGSTFTDLAKYPVQETVSSFQNPSPASLPYNDSSFSIVINALPVYTTKNTNVTDSENTTTTLASPAMLPITSLVRYASGQGYVILGAPEELWTQWKVDEQVATLSEQNQGHMMVMLRMPLPVDDLPTINNTNNTNNNHHYHSDNNNTTSTSTSSSEWNVFSAPTKMEKIRMGDYAKQTDNQRASILYRLGVFRKQ